MHVKSNHTFKCLYEYLNKKLRYRDLIYFILKLLAASPFGMIDLHYEIRICQKIYIRVTMTVYVKCVVRFNVNKTLLTAFTVQKKCLTFKRVQSNRYIFLMLLFCRSQFVSNCLFSFNRKNLLQQQGAIHKVRQIIEIASQSENLSKFSIKIQNTYNF